MERKSLNGNATVDEDHATVGRLSNYVFSTFQAIRKHFEKSHWMVTRQWSEVTRPSADCQTTFFRRFKQFVKFLKKVTERSRDSGRRSRDRRLTVKLLFWTFRAIWKFFEKSHWTVTRQWSEVTRPTFFEWLTLYSQALWGTIESSTPPRPAPESPWHVWEVFAQYLENCAIACRNYLFWVINPLFLTPPGYSRIVNHSATCTVESLTYLWSFNSISWKLCECKSNSSFLSD